MGACFAVLGVAVGKYIHASSTSRSKEHTAFEAQDERKAA
jgi:hypothetical protein